MAPETTLSPLQGDPPWLFLDPVTGRVVMMAMTPDVVETIWRHQANQAITLALFQAARSTASA